MHFYRNGVIEMVDGAILNHTMPSRADVRYIPSLAVERLIATAVDRGVRLIRHIGANAPVSAAVTLTNVKDMVLAFDQWEWYQLHPVLNTHLFFPDAIFTQLTDRAGPILKPLFDLLWNACGIDESPNFDAEGNWVGR